MSLARGQCSHCLYLVCFIDFYFSILEYLSRDDADRAVKELDGKDLRGQPVRVAMDVEVSTTLHNKVAVLITAYQRSGPDNYRRDSRRDDRGRDDRYPREDRYAGRDDRYNRDDRHRDDRTSYRRERSRSPPRRSDYDDRRPARSPPPKRDYDDRRPAGYDDRRGGYDDRRGPDPYYYDRRRDDVADRRRDDRRRDEKEDRFDDRPPRHANGDSGWAR